MSVERKTKLISEKMRGQGLVEYALILVFVAIVVIVAVTVFGTAVKGLYCDIILGFGIDGGTECPVSLLPTYLSAWV